MLLAAYVHFGGHVALAATIPSRPEVPSLFVVIDSVLWAAKLPQGAESHGYLAPLGGDIPLARSTTDCTVHQHWRGKWMATTPGNMSRGPVPRASTGHVATTPTTPTQTGPTTYTVTQ